MSNRCSAKCLENIRVWEISLFPFITSFHYPQHPNFEFGEFYERLNCRGLCIYPGKVTETDCFRVGNIGQLFPDDMVALMEVWPYLLP